MAAVLCVFEDPRDVDAVLAAAARHAGDDLILVGVMRAGRGAVHRSRLTAALLRGAATARAAGCHASFGLVDAEAPLEREALVQAAARGAERIVVADRRGLLRRRSIRSVRVLRAARRPLGRVAQ